MSELLTLGQLIDQLKVGQIAESEDGKTKAYWYRDTLAFDIGLGDYYSIRKDERNIKWSILPNYVSLDEAMKALKDGYTVRCYPEDDGGYIEFNEADTLQSVSNDWTGLTWGAFLHSKWTIEK